MNDQKIINYIIKPTKPFPIRRNCPGCLGKTIYRSTDKFRINANGNRLDVWLIYQCEQCKHTYNLPLYERKRPDEIPVLEYNGFMDNSAALSLQFGTTKSIFTSAHATIDWQSLSYEVLRQGVHLKTEGMSDPLRNALQIENPYSIKVRMEKVLSQILGCSRAKVSTLIKSKELIMDSTETLTTVVLSNHTDSTAVLEEVS